MSSTSTNLLLTLLAQYESAVGSFANWGDAANSNFEFLEDGITEVSNIAVTTADVTLTDAENRSMYLNCTGALTGNRNVIVAARKGFWLVKNGTSGSYSLTVKTSAGTGIAIPQGGTAILVCDGTNVLSIANISSFAATILDDTTQAAAQTTLGLGTGDSPQFNAINLGHASDTTLERSSAGVVSVEGKILVNDTDAQTIAGLKTFGDMVTISAGNATSGNIFATLSPSDAGAGKPYMYFKKTTTADKWELGLWDGTYLSGVLDFELTKLTVANVDVPTAYTVQNYISGLTLSNNGTDATNDIDIAVGACTDSTNTVFITLASAITKRLDAAWAVGTGNGGLDTGTIADGTYHAHLIMRSDTGVVDSLLSLSATSPTMPANYDYSRRIGSIIRSGGTILGFWQFGDEFLLNVPSTALAFTQNSTSALRVLNDVPLGIKVIALIRAMATRAGSSFTATVTSPDTADTAPSLNASPLADLNGAAGAFDRETFTVRTDTSGRVRTDADAAATEMDIVTLGWIDYRGKA